MQRQPFVYPRRRKRPERCSLGKLLLLVQGLGLSLK
jgi:hypothetical protein